MYHKLTIGGYKTTEPLTLSQILVSRFLIPLDMFQIRGILSYSKIRYSVYSAKTKNVHVYNENTIVYFVYANFNLLLKEFNSV